jgi:hypothetical protein
MVLDTEQIREIVRQEIVSFVEILSTEIAAAPMRADGNLNVRDFGQTLEIVAKKLES